MVGTAEHTEGAEMGRGQTHSTGRRLRWIMIDAEQVLDWLQVALNLERGNVQGIRVPVIEGLPRDAHIHSVHPAGFEYGNAIVLVVEHPSFAEVLPGNAIPTASARWTWEQYIVEVRPENRVGEMPTEPSSFSAPSVPSVVESVIDG